MKLAHIAVYVRYQKWLR
jgi:hypothetical protein